MQPVQPSGMLPMPRFHPEAMRKGCKLAWEGFSVQQLVGIHAGQWDLSCTDEALMSTLQMVHLGGGISWLEATRFYYRLVGDVGRD